MEPVPNKSTLNKAFALATPTFPLARVVTYLLFALLVGGMSGYHFIEGWDWFDSLYMTVITVASVGFSEIHPLSTAGRVLTMVLIFLGVVTVVLSTTAFAQFIFPATAI